MDATLTSLEGEAAKVQADAQDKAGTVLAELRKNRDGFRDAIKKQAGANEAAWTSAKTRLETDWSAFEAEVKKYVESYGKQFELQRATFKLQAAAQLKAWRDAADKLASAASEFAGERRAEIETNVERMKADAVAAEEKLLKLNEAGNQSWSALTAALTETRAVFDRANQSAREAFKRVT
ncbi:hypothetical protein [Bradyrhizobium sp.]|uniref:hypothetical protein n=1 Tax=Bradyrhizobium sp. TaxID=376 RepID=UPI0027356D50|nr:hypothetical protein [Bradyrhizobium sp.]MDP3075437.1 hypothetical protein [Bradyrhizobium sp.]